MLALPPSQVVRDCHKCHGASGATTAIATSLCLLLGCYCVHIWLAHDKSHEQLTGQLKCSRWRRPICISVFRSTGVDNVCPRHHCARLCRKDNPGVQRQQGANDIFRRIRIRTEHEHGMIVTLNTGRTRLVVFVICAPSLTLESRFKCVACSLGDQTLATGVVMLSISARCSESFMSSTKDITRVILTRATFPYTWHL